MHDSSGVDLDRFPSAMGIVTRLACRRLKNEGVDVKALLQKAGLTEQQIDDPCSRLAVKDQIRFLDLAAETLKDECLGFHLAQTFDLRMSGLFYYVIFAQGGNCAARRQHTNRWRLLSSLIGRPILCHAGADAARGTTRGTPAFLSAAPKERAACRLRPHRSYQARPI